MTKCYTFYSYKGGSGRTTTALNTVLHLAQKTNASPEHPILLVDADLESAGMTYYFDMTNKFTGLFTHSIHTTGVLASSKSSIFNRREEQSQDEISEQMKDNFAQIFQLKNAAELFAGVLLTKVERDILRTILKSHEAAVNEGYKDVICMRYDLDLLVRELQKITESPLTPAEKAEKKNAKVLDFLPAHTFEDVSHFFGRPYGSVKFLGVDVKHDGEQLAQNGADRQVDILVEACNGAGYSAIVFDSGAGTQSSAHAFHLVSDVLVYCMRPSYQFIKGTRTNLDNYRTILLNNREEKGKEEEQKNIILLPTAVPQAGDNEVLGKNSFEWIARIAASHRDIIDRTFCTMEMALCEVELFKWREQILGTYDAHTLTEDVRAIADRYIRYEDMPGDAKRAYNTYALLADRLIANS